MAEKLLFRYDPDRRRMQSNDPEIYVKGSSFRFPMLYFNLYWGERVIRFAAHKELVDTDNPEVNGINWMLRDIRALPVEPNSEAFNYKDIYEAREAADIMLSFLRQQGG